MKRLRPSYHVLAVFMLLFVLFVFAPKEARADMSGADFAALVRDNEDDTAILLEDVTITEATTIVVSQATTIEMGEYSILNPGGHELTLGGPLHFTGEGVSEGVAKPLFVLADSNGFLAPGRSNSGGVTITVRGTGGVAIKLDGKVWPNLAFATINVQGGNGVGILADYDDDIITCVKIHATGVGATCIKTPEDGGNLSLILCDLAADSGMAVNGPERVSAYGCIVSPPHADMDNIALVAKPGFEDPATQWNIKAPSFEMGAEAYLPDEELLFPVFAVDAWMPPWYPNQFKLPVRWQHTGPIDTSAAGAIFFTGHVQIPSANLPIENFYEFTCDVGIYDTTRPLLYGLDTTYWIYYWTQFRYRVPDGYTGEIVLQVSEDEGESWRLTDFDISFGIINLYDIYEEDKTYWFSLELPDMENEAQRYSNILTLTVDDGMVVATGIGGDRDLSDRDNTGGEDNTPDGNAAGSGNTTGNTTGGFYTGSGSAAGANSGGNTTPGETTPEGEAGAPAGASTGAGRTQPTGEQPPADDGTQPGIDPAAGTNPALNAPKPANAFTGNEIADLLGANPVSLEFFGDGLRVSIPAGALQALALGEDELLQVVLEQRENGVSLRLIVAEQEASTLGAPMELRIPYTPGPDERTDDLYLVSADGEYIPARYEDGALIAVVAGAGEYYVAHRPREETVRLDFAPEPEGGAGRRGPWLLVVAAISLGGAALGVGGYFFLRGRPLRGRPLRGRLRR